VIDPGITSSATYYVHADHLNRPVAMTNAAKAFVANYVWLPYGGLHSYTGTTQIDLRFPGQLMQAESGLYYNWNRQYDPTTGRYTQTDPLGLVDGSSRYAYVNNDPLQQVDPTGRLAIAAPAVAGWVYGLLGGAVGAIIGHEVWPHVFPSDIVSDSAPSGDFCSVNLNLSLNNLLSERPRGFWPADTGADEWARRRNMPPREGRDRFHDIKRSDPGSSASEDYSVNPETGEIKDSHGDTVGYLDE
jgi:RHS repeat-associated protein